MAADDLPELNSVQYPETDNTDSLLQTLQVGIQRLERHLEMRDEAGGACCRMLSPFLASEFSFNARVRWHFVAGCFAADSTAHGLREKGRGNRIVL